MAFFTSLLALSTVALAAPTAPLVEVAKYAGETSGRYIVTLKQGVEKSNILNNFAAKREEEFKVTHSWKTLINGFAGAFDDVTLEELRASSDVEAIEEDGVFSIFATQTDAPWGISRVSSDSPISGSDSALDYEYTYGDAAGEGVDIYIVDTGILTTHEEFGGRASWGGAFGGLAEADGHGHGTHCAGIAASASYGVAKKASLIAVKVLDDGGSGWTTDIVDGLEFVADNAASTGNPSIASLSLGGGASSALDNAVTALVEAGIHVTVAAGNSATDAANTSPARATAVTTVGATAVNDRIATYSNYGAVVDIFAPGTNVISTWSTSDTATNSISGTSMATPHIAGLTAYFISVLGNDSPAGLLDVLTEYGVTDAISGIPSGTTTLFAHNDQ